MFQDKPTFKCEDGFAYIRRFGSTISMEPQNVEENEENWYLYRSISTRTEQSDMMTIKFGIYLFHHNQYS